MSEQKTAPPRAGGVPLVPLPPGGVPRRWQEEAMLAIREALPRHRSILVSAATGTGKGTMIAAMVVKAAMSGKRVLFLVHRDELIDDVMARVRQVSRDFTCGKIRGTINETDRQAVFASVQSLHKRRLPTLNHFDFVVTDEAHHATARSYRAVYARVEEVNPKWKHIGFTATPFRSAGKGKTTGLGSVFEALVYEYSLAQAIQDGALAPLRGVQVETLLDLSGVDPDNEAAVQALVDTDERNLIVAQKYLEFAAGKPAICFGVSVKHAQRLAQAMADLGIRAGAVWGADERRAEKIAAYKAGRITVLCNCGILTEGFDAPSTAAVLLARPTQSRGLYAQMVGRATRLAPGKEEGLLIDFVANSSTHDLASIKDLSPSPPEKPRIKPNDQVRHRKLDWGVGRVREVQGWVSADEEGDALVEWMDGAEWIACRFLAINVGEGEPKEEIIIPKVKGVASFPVQLFGDGVRPAWYKYEGSKAYYVAKDKSCSSIMRKVGDVWQLWERVGATAAPHMVAQGEFRQIEGLCSVRGSDQGLDREWLLQPASEAQIAALRKFKIRREGLSKGEASLILELKIMLLNIEKVEEE